MSLVDDELAALIARGTEEGSLELSQIEQLVDSLALPDETVERLLEEIAAAGILVEDDVARPGAGPAAYENGELAWATADSRTSHSPLRPACVRPARAQGTARPVVVRAKSSSKG